MVKDLHQDYLSIKEMVLEARRRGILTPKEVEGILTGTARAIQILKEVLEGKTIEAREGIGPLPEFMRWPNKSFPCPKCDAIKSGKVYYVPPNRIDPERMRHSCTCEYSIYTKPVDQSSDEYHREEQNLDDATF